MDITEFERLSTIVFTQPNSPEFAEAQEKLEEIRNNFEQIYQSIIINFSNCGSFHAKFLLLTFFKDYIQHKWLSIPYSKKNELMKFFFSIMTFDSQIFNDNEISENGFQVILDEVDAIIIEIMKLEWPENCSTFVRDSIQRAKLSQHLLCCKNVLYVFQLLSDEVYFCTNKRYFSSSRLQELKEQLNIESHIILSFITDVLGNEMFDIIVKTQAFKTLESFLRWLNPDMIFDIFIVQMAKNLFVVDEFKSPILYCFAAIANSLSQSSDFGKLINAAFSLLINQLSKIDLNIDNINEVHAHALALALTSFLSYQNFKLISIYSYISSNNSPKSLQQNNLIDSNVDSSINQLATSIDFAVKLLLQLTDISYENSFKICLDFWDQISTKSLTSNPTIRVPTPIIGNLQIILTNHINEDCSEQIISVIQNTSKFEHDILKNWIFEQLNSLSFEDIKLLKISYAVSALIASISNLNEENQFVSDVLNIFIQRLSAPNNTISKICIMKIAASTIRFFFNNQNIFSFILGKSVEWMIEGSKNSEIQSVIFNHFKSICHRFPSLFEKCLPIFSQLMSNFNKLCQTLPDELLPDLFRSICIVCKSINTQKQLFIQQMLDLPINKWNECLNQMQDNDSFKISSFVLLVKILSSIISVDDQNINSYLVGCIKMSLTLFANISITISEKVLSLNYSAQPMNDNELFVLKILKDSLYNLFKALLENDSPLAIDAVKLIIDDYKQSDPSVRFPQVFDCLITFLNKFQNTNILPIIIEYVIYPTIQFLTNQGNCELADFEIGLFTLMEQVFIAMFHNFIPIDDDYMSSSFRIIEWGIKRNNPEIVSVVINFIIKVISESSEQFSIIFFEIFYIPLIVTLLETLIGRSDENLFDNYTKIINLMFKLAPRATDSPDAMALMIVHRLLGIFHNLDEFKLYECLMSLILESDNYQKFHITLHDFLVDYDHGCLLFDGRIEDEIPYLNEIDGKELTLDDNIFPTAQTTIKC